jgi:hypothetical protein
MLDSKPCATPLDSHNRGFKGGLSSGSLRLWTQPGFHRRTESIEHAETLGELSQTRFRETQAIYVGYPLTFSAFRVYYCQD